MRSSLASRIAVLGILLIASCSSKVFDGSVNGLRFTKPSASLLVVGDADSYLKIAQVGYATASSRAYFPLYPLILRVAPDRFRWLWGLVFSNASFLLAAALMYRLVLVYGWAEEEAARAVIYLSIFPGSHFFSVLMSESLFLLLCVGSLLAARKRRWLLAGICAALASATRAPGIALLPALAVELWVAYRTVWRREIGVLAIAPLGLLAFSGWLWRSAGDPLAFVHAQTQFHNTMWTAPVIGFLRHPSVFHMWAFYPLYLLSTVIWITSAVWLVYKRQWALATFTGASLSVILIAFPLATNRYLLGAFPAFILLALWFRGEWYTIISASGMAVLTVLYAAHYGLAAT